MKMKEIEPRVEALVPSAPSLDLPMCTAQPKGIHKKFFHLCTSLVCTGKSECYTNIFRTKGVKQISLFTCAEN